ncbi:MAG: [FeFe] hydrogenase, group A [Planctomycetaceae bacterium]|jgi:iron-only hydrogenase group A|nr:[FeFe] hydrogenase, group A [Planctomycetaceae bacterium]
MRPDNSDNIIDLKNDENPEILVKQDNEGAVSRRNFIRFAAGTGIVAVSAVGCGGPAGGEGWFPAQYNEQGNFPPHVRGRVPINPGNVSITRDNAKCILCGQCTEACSKMEAVMFHYELPLIDDIPCINCGQCSLWCPTGAITEVDDTARFLEALEDPNVHVVVQTAPSTRVGLGEEFGMPAGTNVEGSQVAALKALGVDTVLDTNFAADLTIMEEAKELVRRLKRELDEPIPQFTSCCPGWVRFCEYFYPDLIPNLSTTRSPMGILGAMIKTYYAEKRGIDPKNIFSVSIMPCTAKKYEAVRPEMNNVGRKLGDPLMRDTDLVLTTRELARLIKMRKIDFLNLESAPYDKMLSEYTGAGAIFGVTGGVMEAAVRTAYTFITGENPPASLLEFQPVRGLTGMREAELEIPSVGKVNVAVIAGMGNAHKILDQVRAGKSKWQFVEFMACPGGCISGGGQPRTALPPSPELHTARIDSIYSLDEKSTIRLCHENPEIKTVYKDYLGEPNSELAEQLLHTHFDKDYHKHLTPKKSV